jgi:hypothetical protein
VVTPPLKNAGQACGFGGYLSVVTPPLKNAGHACGFRK